MMSASKPRRMTDDGELHELADYVEPEPERVFCTQCGTSNPPDSRYCRNCGHSLIEGQEAPALQTLQKPKRSEQSEAQMAAQTAPQRMTRMGPGMVIFELTKLVIMGTLVYLTSQTNILVTLAVLLVWMMTEMARHGALTSK